MHYFQKSARPTIIDSSPDPRLAQVVAIPCSDEPDLLRTLASVAACGSPPSPVEVIVVINSAENATEKVKKRNLQTLDEARFWAKTNERTDLRFHFLHFSDLPPKSAGVGLARKIAMDEAAQRLFSIQNERAPIVCLDADSRVEPNYLQAIDRFFEKNPRCSAASIHFEHPLEGDEFGPETYAAIVRYELHLRFYVHALRRSGLPTAVQTVGSAMAVRADAYVAEGGMNRRQAGEDFYFLHKFTPLGHFGQITETTVVPSPRTSWRVPFGTGRAVGEMLEGKAFSTYSPAIFDDLKAFFAKIELFRSLDLADATAFSTALAALPPSISEFLKKENFEEKLRELRANTAGRAAFEKRFFRWADAFWAMKCVHFARDRFHPNIEIEAAARAFLGAAFEKAAAQELLLAFRKMDRAG